MPVVPAICKEDSGASKPIPMSPVSSITRLALVCPLVPSLSGTPSVVILAHVLEPVYKLISESPPKS